MKLSATLSIGKSIVTHAGGHGAIAGLHLDLYDPGREKKPAGGPGADAFAGRAAVRAGAGPDLEHMLAAFMDDDQADATLRTITNWARYAELFTYDSKTGLFSLENE